MPIDDRLPMKLLRYLAASVVFAVAVACSTAMTKEQGQQSERSNQVAPTSETVLLIAQDGCSYKVIPGVRVELISIRRGERRVLGRTDELGAVAIPRAVLRDGDFLLYCREGFFCGATDLSKYKVGEYNVFKIYLARFRI